MVVVHEIGPRIASFGFGGLGGPRDNLLYWNDAGDVGRGHWRLRGGHRLWLTRPLADETEETYAPDDVRCRVRRMRDGVVVTAPPDAARLEKSLSVREHRGAWIIEHRVRNVGDMMWSGG